MFVLTNFSVVDRSIAAVLATALVLWAVGAHSSANAAGLEQVSDTISTSAPSVNADHTIEFTMPAGSSMDPDDEIRITIPAGFTVPAMGDEDVDLDVDGNEEAVDGTDWSVASVGNVITITAENTGAATVSAADVVIIEIGLNATADGAGDTQIQNSAVIQSHEVDIEIYDEGATLQDSASTRIVMVDQVIVTADVDTIFDFFVSGVATTTTIDTESTDVGTATTSIPFGTLSPGTAKVAAQTLRVETNAINGFEVTVETDQQLTAGNGAVIDSFIDAADTAVDTVWAPPTGTLGVVTSYGHWGMRHSDTTDVTQTYADGNYTAVLTTPTQVMTSTGPTDGTVDNEGITQVMYKAEIMAFQEAADDYTATLTYIATPTF